VTTIRNVAELTLAVLFFFVVLSWARDEPDLYFLARAIMVMGAATAAIAVLFYIIPEAWTVRILDALADSITRGAPARCGTSRMTQRTQCVPSARWWIPTCWVVS